MMLEFIKRQVRCTVGGVLLPETPAIGEDGLTPEVNL